MDLAIKHIVDTMISIGIILLDQPECIIPLLEVWAKK